ncbi:hypothetical protein D6D23_10005 [Aureobasidium pullulans]|nr:hypothetical protein D6D23_10005 [Aureobasidium pullulans]
MAEVAWSMHIINTAKSRSSLTTACICIMSENVAPGPRRGGRERTSTQRYQDLQQPASSTTSKRKRLDTSNTAVDARPKKSLKSQDQADASPSNSKSAGKRVNSDNTRAKANAKTTTKSRLDGPAKDAGNFVDLTEDDDEAVSSSAKKPNRTKSQKGEEKRLKPVRKQAPQKYTTIAYRATTQRMVVIDRRRPNNDDCPHGKPHCPMEEVDLAGSTGNIYTVRITHVPECTCPDFRINRNPQCKHILYVLLKVLKAPEPLHYQAAFLTSELDDMFDHAGPLPTETVHAEDKDGKRKPIEGDCPICCEELSQETEAIVWCQAACGNNLHKTCFDQWAATKGHDQVTCPYCRTQWQNEVDGSALKGMAKAGPKNKDGYVNVAAQVGMSTRRDYSSYNEYWVRGQRRDGLIDDDDDDDYDLPEY